MKKKADFSKSSREAVRWRVLDRTVQTIKRRNQDVTTGDLETAIDRAVREVRREMRRGKRGSLRRAGCSN
ncbi:MAG: hypothetical protein HY246_22565 [Proteobacteria bacterium]|nr:hypothetical protein [Pseudomonadota bacterium]